MGSSLRPPRNVSIVTINASDHVQHAGYVRSNEIAPPQLRLGQLPRGGPVQPAGWPGKPGYPGTPADPAQGRQGMWGPGSAPCTGSTARPGSTAQNPARTPETGRR